MKYVIYEMISPEHLQKTVHEGYYINTLQRHVLQPVDNEHSRVKASHDSMESALKEIEDNKEELKWCQLTILPVISIDYEGNIS